MRVEQKVLVFHLTQPILSLFAYPRYTVVARISLLPLYVMLPQPVVALATSYKNCHAKSWKRSRFIRFQGGGCSKTRRPTTTSRPSARQLRPRRPRKGRRGAGKKEKASRSLSSEVAWTRNSTVEYIQHEDFFRLEVLWLNFTCYFSTELVQRSASLFWTSDTQSALCRMKSNFWHHTYQYQRNNSSE